MNGEYHVNKYNRGEMRTSFSSGERYASAVCAGLFLFAAYVFAPAFFDMSAVASTTEDEPSIEEPTTHQPTPVAENPVVEKPREVEKEPEVRGEATTTPIKPLPQKEEPPTQPTPPPATPTPPQSEPQNEPEVPAPTVTPPARSSFIYTFDQDGILAETGKRNESSSRYFWVSSGGRMLMKSGIGSTILGKLTADDPTRVLYGKMNPLDTDNGYQPQNTFRLVSSSEWGNAETSVRFNIVRTNLTATPNRDGYSGVFLMGRYSDQYNLYYIGIRHDGLAVIKKKIKGTYYTLATAQVFGDKATYHKTTNANMIPIEKWMSLKGTFENLPDGSVRITGYLAKDGTNSFTKIVTALDTGTGGSPLFKGASGLRTDYMDVQFDDFTVAEL